MTASMEHAGESFVVQGQGSGPIDAFVNGVNRATGHAVRVLDYHEHALGAGADARAIAYLELRIDEQQTLFGVGIDVSFVTASLKAIVCALARAKIERRIPTPESVEKPAVVPDHAVCF